VNSKCEYVEQCPIAKYFGETGWTLTASRYCRDGEYQKCQRYKLRTAGQPVPKRLMPWDAQPA
jgi:hypothetical protein